MQSEIESAEQIIQEAVIEAFKRLFAERPDIAPIMACCGAITGKKNGKVTLWVNPTRRRTLHSEKFKAFEISRTDCLKITPQDLADALCNWLVREADAGNVTMLSHPE